MPREQNAGKNHNIKMSGNCLKVW